MLLSGVSPEEACRRWRELKVLSFASVWPLRRLLAGPPYPALGTSTGIRERVFPALGVDVERIRSAQGIDGTFNVCDFASKECIAVPHTDADLDVLTAGVSLPVFSPAVERDGRKLIDAVWIKDTNVTEALRRGAEEIWLVWCIGNHGVYRDGAFQQYVHMIEIAANGALQEELALVRERGARLHVIRPRVPLPLDPDFFFGRVDASTLIAMGYRDAAAYLDAPHADGVAPDAAATRMEDPVPGVAFRERLSGERPGAAARVGGRRPGGLHGRPEGHGGRRRHPPGARRPAPRSRGAVQGRRRPGERRASVRAVTRRAPPQPARPRPRGGAHRRRRTGSARAQRPAGLANPARARRGLGARGRAGAAALLALAQKRHAELVLQPNPSDPTGRSLAVVGVPPTRRICMTQRRFASSQTTRRTASGSCGWLEAPALPARLAIFVAACGDDDESSTAQDSSSRGTSTTKSNGSMKGDLEIVQYALTLEHLETDFYNAVIDSGVVKDKALAETAKMIRDNEQEHVDALTGTVKQLGGKPMRPKTNFDAVLEGGEKMVLETAATVENLGAAAYLGQAGRIQSKEILAAALAIHCVEGRHAAALNTVVGKTIVPDGAFAKPASMAEVLPKVKPFLA